MLETLLSLYTGSMVFWQLFGLGILISIELFFISNYFKKEIMTQPEKTEYAVMVTVLILGVVIVFFTKRILADAGLEYLSIFFLGIIPKYFIKKFRNAEGETWVKRLMILRESAVFRKIEKSVVFILKNVFDSGTMIEGNWCSFIDVMAGLKGVLEELWDKRQELLKAISIARGSWLFRFWCYVRGLSNNKVIELKRQLKEVDDSIIEELNSIDELGQCISHAVSEENYDLLEEIRVEFLESVGIVEDDESLEDVSVSNDRVGYERTIYIRDSDYEIYMKGKTSGAFQILSIPFDEQAEVTVSGVWMKKRAVQKVMVTASGIGMKKVLLSKGVLIKEEQGKE
jgi:hypothetical protein